MCCSSKNRLIHGKGLQTFQLEDIKILWKKISYFLFKTIVENLFENNNKTIYGQKKYLLGNQVLKKRKTVFSVNWYSNRS